MYYDCKVEIPIIKGKISYTGMKDTKYVSYETGRIYKPEKGYNIPTRTTIGKVCPDDPKMMYPNPNYLKFFPDEVLPNESARTDRSSCLRVGASLVIQKILNDYELNEILEGIVGRDAGLFLDLVAYTIICEDNAGQYYPDYAYNHPLATEDMKVYSDAKVSDFLKSIGDGRSIMFLNEWNEKRDKSERIYITYDSTSKNCQSGDIEIAEFGRPKEYGSKNLFNYSVAYDHNNREPLFYESYPGSIVDVSQLQLMLEKAQGYGYQNVGFILDRGYFSAPNIRFMDKNDYSFVIMVKGMKKLVSGLIEEHKGTFEENRKNSIRAWQVSGKTVKSLLYPTDERERYFHIYYNPHKYAAEREALENKIDRMSKELKKLYGKKIALEGTYENYFELIYHGKGEDRTFMSSIERTDVINRDIKLCGYFVIITSEEMTSEEALTLYKSRDASEKLFRSDKSYLGNNCLRVHSDESAEGKIFVEFVALIVRNKIYTLLKDEMNRQDKKFNYFSVPAALKELEKIEMIRFLDGVYRLDYAVSSVQKNILNAFGVNEQWIKKKANQINDSLISTSAAYNP